jgi:Ca2+-binding RTX toxin-like protein
VRTFTYTLSDGAGGTTTGTVTVNVVALAPGNTADTVNLSSITNYQAAYIDARAGADTVTDGSGLSVLLGGTGADALTGNAGNDLLIGGDNNDTLLGGDGNDVLRGGIGNNDSMNGGNGTEDMLDFSDGTVGVTFTLVQSAATTSIANGTGGLGNNDTYANMEGVIGTNLVDNITGSTGNDVIRGGGGNDTLNGAGGTDLLDFSEVATGFSLTLGAGGSGTATATGTDSYSNMEGVIGGNGADTITGNATANELRGGGGNDILNGAGGDDILIGGAGADMLTGGTGSDTFRYRNGDASAVDTISDFNSSSPGSGGDVLDISDVLIGAPTLTAGNVAQYLDIRENGSDSIVSIDRDGTGGAFGFQDFAVLQGVTGLSLTSLLANGNIDWTP